MLAFILQKSISSRRNRAKPVRWVHLPPQGLARRALRQEQDELRRWEEADRSCRALVAAVRTLAFVRSHWGHWAELWHEPIYTAKHCFAQYMEQREVNVWESMAEIQGRKMMVSWTNMATMMSKKLTSKYTSAYFEGQVNRVSWWRCDGLWRRERIFKVVK